MKTKVMPFLLLAATNFLFVGTAAQIMTRAQFKAVVKERLDREILSIQQEIRQRGLYAYSSRYRKWVEEKKAIDILKEARTETASAAAEDSGNGQEKKGRKKGWRRRRWRRRRRGRFPQRKKRAKRNRNRVNDESLPGRNLRGIEHTIEGNSSSVHARSAWAGQNQHSREDFRREKMKHGLLQKNDWQRRRRIQSTGTDVDYSELSALSFIISALSPFLQSNFLVPELWCAGVDPLTWNGNPFTADPPTDLKLIECLEAALGFDNPIPDVENFTLWEIEVATTTNPDDIPASTAHLKFLNDITNEVEDDDPTDDEIRREEFNVWMSVENEIEENQMVQADRTSVFDMAPVDENKQKWFFLPGPTGDRTWRPWPQGPYYGAYSSVVRHFPYDRQLCVSAQKHNGTVRAGNEVVLKLCTDKGKSRKRQTWVFCAETFEAAVRPIDPPLFDVRFTIVNEFTSKPTPGPTRRPTPAPNSRPTQPSPRPTPAPVITSPSTLQDYLDQVVKDETLFAPDTDAEITVTCTFTEDSLEEGQEPGNWNREFSLDSSAEIEIEVNTQCNTEDSQTLGLDTVFRLYKASTIDDDDRERECIASTRLSCDPDDSAGTVHTFTRIELDEDRKYFITATGNLEGEVTESGDFDCFF